MASSAQSRRADATSVQARLPALIPARQVPLARIANADWQASDASTVIPVACVTMTKSARRTTRVSRGAGSGLSFAAVGRGVLVGGWRRIGSVLRTIRRPAALRASLIGSPTVRRLLTLSVDGASLWHCSGHSRATSSTVRAHPSRGRPVDILRRQKKQVQLTGV